MITTISKQRITLFMNPSIITQAKAQAVIDKVTLTELVEKALHTYLPKVTIITKNDTREPVNRQ